MSQRAEEAIPESEMTSEQAAILDLDRRLAELERVMRLAVADVRKLMRDYIDRKEG